MLHAFIHGRVQGVGFRWATCEHARALGLVGWVRNRRDGSVEVLAAGPQQALDQLRDWLAHGPPGARVERITLNPTGDTPPATLGTTFQLAADA